ncbi:uncharacterized protein UTRI_03013 [Ustilago trichophora]|uniref:Uncharacterized protein n=1 Tax=Ustilago trichophora TaxID=86804 RepID=A0A5C3E5F0_9BASI|nr:uncharacterized protein UTRI_03013 [Ustilago trichophora]
MSWQFTITNNPALLKASDTNQAVLTNALAQKARNAITSSIGVQNARHYSVDIDLEKGPRYHVSRRRMIQAGQAVAVAFAVNYIGISNRGLDHITPELAPTFQLPGSLGNLTVYVADGDVAQATQTMFNSCH